MRFASYTTPSGAPTWGAAVDGELFDLGPSGANLAPSLKAAIESGAIEREISLDGLTGVKEESVAFLPVIPDPQKIICIGVNYVAHREETGRPPAEAPTIFTRFADSQTGHGQRALRPATTEKFDYEAELAIVIGKEAFHVAEADAWDHVIGAAPYNDFSVRDWQRHTPQWTPGKNFPETGAFGPYLTPMSDIEDFDSLVLEGRVNGEVRQHAPLSDLVFNVPQLIAYVTGFTRLYPGDVIVTGTPGGAGLFRNPPGLLSEGDVVEIEVTGLGVLRNTVVQEPAA